MTELANRAVMLQRDGNPHEALTLLEEALAGVEAGTAVIPPGSRDRLRADLLVNVGNALYRLGRFEEALAAYDDALGNATGNVSAALFNRALCHDRLGARTAAARDLSAAASESARTAAQNRGASPVIDPNVDYRSSGQPGAPPT